MMSVASSCSSTPRTIAPRADTKVMALSPGSTALPRAPARHGRRCSQGGHYAVTLRGRPGLRVTLAGGGVPTTLLLALALSLLLATLAGSGAATSIVFALVGFTATGFLRDCPSPMFLESHRKFKKDCKAFVASAGSKQDGERPERLGSDFPSPWRACDNGSTKRLTFRRSSASAGSRSPSRDPIALQFRCGDWARLRRSPSRKSSLDRRCRRTAF